MSFFGFGSSCDIRIEFKNQDQLKKVTVKNENGDMEDLFLFTGHDTLEGTVFVDVPKQKKVEHIGIKIELIGMIEYLYDRGNPYEFSQSTTELEGPGELAESKKISLHLQMPRGTVRNLHGQQRPIAVLPACEDSA